MENYARLLKVQQGSAMPPTPAEHELLFGFNFGLADGAGPRGMVPALDLDPIGESPSWETWWYRGEVDYRRVGNVAVAECADFVAAVIQLPDSETADILRATRKAYGELLGVVRSLEPLTIVRIWNYFSRINDGVGDSERYRQFSVGRAESFEASGLAEVQSPPGTAIGGELGSPFTIVLLASRHPCRLVENPRQMSAFQYPLDYGPRSPRFSRGGVLSLPCGGLFLVSGTAAIVGHTSCRTENIEEQALETFRNLEALLQSAGLPADLGALHAVRVYLRERKDVAVVQSLIKEWFGAYSHVTYLRGDICRRELDMEIDGVVFA